MPRLSAGVLMYRTHGGHIEVLLAHPGGPFWSRKDAGAWSIPKGECMPGEPPLAAARREFEEETGIVVQGNFLPLGEEKMASGKTISVWAVEGDCDPSGLRSNTFQIEWPPRSGKMAEFPEVDRWEWFPIEEARKRILKGQVVFLDRLASSIP
ncbi:NUDIX domain-containing protein [Pseudacidobacterium ailaaui]|jgi:predicted NUDIX family NTP pyrophosphohydrolase|uniref:NUDIX domain-containing protein n=1 Tax=Pseudacidobacterium ailaaui TaxID=1382359 RepID=UPI00047A9698|nr:NUDIX domain-containing protein [Pseudacidobacterium ailaaui]MBX6359444.1 NUDIX domain-containing protein [Pseudacidobacterium ailaaui]MCL6464720.1 NUDIX domain-containing protein [Pseudacidobacterium ailaaui]